MEALFLNVYPIFMRRLLSAAGLICRLNSSISSLSVMSGCCSIFLVIWFMVCCVTLGFRP